MNRFLPATLLGVLILPALTAEAAAVDLTKIERTIAKEPAYQSKAPKYCLLVFGLEAKTRVWLVLDGDVLYVDKNGNGDLTEEGERIAIKEESGSRSFPVGDIVEADGKTKHTDVKVYPYEQLLSVSVMISRIGSQTAYVQPADQPRDAPIVHFNGPLTMQWFNAFVKYLARGDKPSDLAFTLGTPGLGKETFAQIGYTKVPTDVFPEAEIEFPSKEPGGKPIQARVVLAKRC